MPIYSRQQHGRLHRNRYNSSTGDCSSTSACSANSSSSTIRRQRRRCCHCCCHQFCNGLLNSVGPLFNVNSEEAEEDDLGAKERPEAAAATLLIWLLLVLQFLVKCIRFFAVQYELTGLAEMNDLYAFLNDHWTPGGARKRRKRPSVRKNKNRFSKGYYTATTTRSEASSSEMPSPVVQYDDDDDSRPLVDVDAEVEKTKKRQRIVVTIPGHLNALYTSPGASLVLETNYITCIFEATGYKVLEVVDDIRKELYLWHRIHNLVTVCCEMSWTVAADERHVPSEVSIQQTVLDHMQMNQRRIDHISMALYDGRSWLKTLSCTPVVQQQCASKNGAWTGRYRRLYPTLLPLVHSETADVHDPYWHLNIHDDSHPPTVYNDCRRSTFQLNLICVALDEQATGESGVFYS